MGYNDLLLLLAHNRPNLSYTAASAAAVVALLLGLVVCLGRSKAADLSRKQKHAPDKNPWVLQFPPSRRHALADLKVKGTTAPYTTPNAEVLRKRAVPTKRTADWDRDNQYTPTGFTTQDIRALGRFPDYAVLTGVRDPQPYGPQFDINKAMFRPFRPFRWNYHQTMGKYSLCLCVCVCRLGNRR